MATGIDLIFADHQRVNDLFGEFDATRDLAVVGRVIQMLADHDQAEHATLYPLAKAVLGDEALLERSLVAHSAVKMAIDHLRQLEGEALVTAVGVLQGLVTTCHRGGEPPAGPRRTGDRRSARRTRHSLRTSETTRRLTGCAIAGASFQCRHVNGGRSAGLHGGLRGDSASRVSLVVRSAVSADSEQIAKGGLRKVMRFERRTATPQFVFDRESVSLVAHVEDRLHRCRQLTRFAMRSGRGLDSGSVGLREQRSLRSGNDPSRPAESPERVYGRLIVALGAMPRTVSVVVSISDDLAVQRFAMSAEEVVSAVPEVVFVFDDDGVLQWCNARAIDLYGSTDLDLIGRHGSELVHPDDVALGLELFVSARATGAGVKEPVVYRLGTRELGWSPYDCIATVIDRGAGRAVFVLSGRPRGQQRSPAAIFDEASSRVAAMFDQSLIGMAQVAVDGRLLRANERFAGLIGCTDAGALVGVPLVEGLADEAASLVQGEGSELSALRIPMRAAARGAVERRQHETPPVVAVAHVSSTLVRDHRGAPMYYAIQAVDVTALHRTQESLRARCRELDDARRHLQRLVVHDALTGLLNRRGLDQWASTCEPTWAAYIDVIDFKSINDNFGHACGDEVLIEVGARLRVGIRRTDCVARVGGDEFAVLGVGPAELGDRQALERRIQLLFDRPVITASESFAVRLRIGIARRASGQAIWDLLEQADRALYQRPR